MSDDETYNEPKINYSTDYMLDKLQNNEKMISTDKRLPIIDENSSNVEDYYTEDDHNNHDDKYEYSKHNSDNDSILDGDKNSTNGDYEYETPAKSKHIYNELFGKDDDYDSLSKQQQLVKRLEVMTELGELVKYNGTKLTQAYNLESDYYTMKCELMIHKDIKSKEFFVSNLTSLTCAFAGGVESYNKLYNPFGLDLNGWAEGVESQSFELINIWSDIYTKYGSPGKDMAPEMRLFYCLAIGPIMYDKNKKQEEANKKKLRQFQQNEDAMRQMRQVKQMNYASKAHESQDIQKQMKEQSEMIRQQREIINKQQLNFDRSNIEKSNMEKKHTQENSMKDQDYNRMRSFYKENEDKRTNNIKNQLNTIKTNINTINDPPPKDTRNDDIKNIINKMENESKSNSVSSYDTMSSSDSHVSYESEKSKKSHKSIFSKSKKGNKRIISIKT